MSRTTKDTHAKRNHYKIGKKMKLAAKEKRKTLKNESNPRVFKLKSANKWDWS